MHTSTRLCASDFYFWQHTSSAMQPVDFATFAPDYHEQDRVGVISLGLEDGVLQTSYALLALTTAFYDRLRAKHEEFFDYPQHFAFVGAEFGEELGAGSNTAEITVHAGRNLLPVKTPQLWNAWSWLDVWPDAKWVTAPTDASGMMQRVFDYQINRLFWPRALRMDAQESQLPAYVWKMLKSSLKAVYLYGDSDAAWSGLVGERMEIRVLAAAQEIVQESIVQLPAPLLLPGALDVAQAATAPQIYERVSVHDFLAAMQREFEAAHS